MQGMKSAVLVVYFSDPQFFSTGGPGGAVLVTEPDGGAAPVRTQGGDLCEAHRQPQAARGARRAHVSGHPRQAQREPFSLTASTQDACPMWLLQSDMRYAGCAMPSVRPGLWYAPHIWHCHLSSTGPHATCMMVDFAPHLVCFFTWQVPAGVESAAPVAWSKPIWRPPEQYLCAMFYPCAGAGWSGVICARV